jgi:hypothetical protein
MWQQLQHFEYSILIEGQKLLFSHFEITLVRMLTAVCPHALGDIISVMHDTVSSNEIKIRARITHTRILPHTRLTLTTFP